MNAIAHIDDVVFIQDQQVKTTSLKVAEVFAKQHKDVLRKLESLECSSDFNERNFTLVEYKDAKGENRPMYEMSKDGFIFLVMGFTGAAAAKIKEAYINTFNQMAAMLYNLHGNNECIHIGAVVQLKSGGPIIPSVKFTTTITALCKMPKCFGTTKAIYAVTYCLSPVYH